MASMILDTQLEKELIAHRVATGADRYDEVWDGIYMMSPLANNEHQWLATKLAFVFESQLERQGASIFAGCNVSDRIEDWARNYRCPDVAVFLKANAARDCGTHWFGGPDLAVEITSPGDRSRDKIAFYETVSVHELIIIDRDPWQLELFSRHEESLRSTGVATVDQGFIRSVDTQLDFSLTAAPSGRPRVEIQSSRGPQSWRL